MSWRVEFQPDVEQDVAEAAGWYEARQPGLGAQFVEEIIRTAEHGWSAIMSLAAASQRVEVASV